MSEVQIKPLEWVDEAGNGTAWTCESFVGKHYKVFTAWWGKEDKWGWVCTDSDDQWFHTEEEAKAAAQADYEARIRSALLPAALSGMAEPVKLGMMPSLGKASFNELAAAVAEAVVGSRDHEFEFEHENLFIGHQIVPTINFNSLNRIVTAFVNGSAAPPVSDLREENERLRAGIKRLSDEEERCAETTGDDPSSLVYLAAKLTNAESQIAQLTKDNTQLSEALRDIRRAIMEDTTALNDTLWMTDDAFKGGTVVDFIDCTLNQEGK